MADYVPHLKLTHEGALKMPGAGIAKALDMKQRPNTLRAAIAALPGAKQF